jgi:fluoroquinolone resistance protein
VSELLGSKAEYEDRTFERLSLERAEIASTTFRECRFKKCTFEGCVLRGCSFSDCVFTDCDLSLMRVPHSTFAATRFADCKLMGVNWAEARWPSRGIWPPLCFERCVLDHSTFLGLDMGGATFEECTAKETDFRESLLLKAGFRGTDLEGALFNETDLTGADLRGAINYSIDPGANKLKGAKFSLPEAMSLLAGLDIEVTGWD